MISLKKQVEGKILRNRAKKKSDTKILRKRGTAKPYKFNDLRSFVQIIQIDVCAHHWQHLPKINEQKLGAKIRYIYIFKALRVTKKIPL